MANRKQQINAPIIIPPFTRTNFITDDLRIESGAQPLFLYFTRGDVTSKHTGETGLRFLKNEQKLILRILIYMTYCFQGHVYLLYLEPSLLEDQTTVSPPLRCSLTSDMVLVFVMRKRQSWSPQSLANSLAGDTEPFDDAASRHSNQSCRSNRSNESDSLLFKDSFFTDAIDSMKRLVCLDMNLTSSVNLYVMQNDKEKSDLLLSAFDWNKWSYNSEEIDKKVRMFKGCLEKQLDMGNPTLINSNSIVQAISVYMAGKTNWQIEGGVIPAHDAFWYLLQQLKEPNHRIYKTFKRNYPESPAVEFIDQLSGPGDGEITLATSSLLLFRYDLNQLMNKDNFNLFEYAPLLKYPYRDYPGTSETIESYLMDVSSGRLLVTTEDRMMGSDREFVTIWPHLKAVKGVCAQLDLQPRGEPLDTLRLKCEIFNSIVIQNGDKIPTEPTKYVFSKCRSILAGGISQFLSTGCTGTVVCTDTTCAPKIADFSLLHSVFVQMHSLTRNTQALLSLTHILHSTAPKWKINKTMLINYTKEGTGKSHTNKILNTIFSKVHGLFDSMTSFTDTVWKYSELHVSKVMFMDDIGLSNKQKQFSKTEDAAMAGQFKSILDVGYTNNKVTDDTRTVNNHTMVYNVAFIWNTNTLESFSDAWTDRCIVLGSEPMTGVMEPKSETLIREEMAAKKVQERFHIMYLRHHLMQTMIFTLTQDCMPSVEADKFARGLLTSLSLKFPASTNQSTPLRSQFKLLDMSMGESVRTGLNALFDWWVPPWTVCPELEGTAKEFLHRLHKARSVALSKVGLAELCVEAMAQIKVFLPSSVVQTVSICFNQNVQSVLSTVFKIMVKALNYNEPGIIEGDGRLVCFNNLHVVAPEQFVKEQAVVAEGKNISVERDQTKIRVVDGVVQNQLRIDAWMAMELYKLHKAPGLAELVSKLTAVFREEVASAGRPSRVTLAADSTLERNLLTLLALQPNQNQVECTCQSGNQFHISPQFCGIATQLAAEHLLAKGALPEWTLRLPLTHHRLNGGDPPWGDLREVPPSEVPNLCHEFARGDICWFGPEYLEQHLLGRDHCEFQHSRYILMPNGNKMTACCGETYAGEEVSWEYHNALQVYKKYLPPEAVPSPREVKEQLSRYVCCYAAGSSPAKEDPYLVSLSEVLPRGEEEANRVLFERYRISAKEIQDRSEKQKQNRKRLREENEVQCDAELSHKRMLSDKGFKLLKDLQKLC